jgi:hypothetical protein
VIGSRWGARFSAPVQTGPGAHPASCIMDTGSFPGVNSGRGVTLTPHPLLVPWSSKGRANPLLTLWVVYPVQSFSACTRVTFIFFTFTIFRTAERTTLGTRQMWVHAFKDTMRNKMYTAEELLGENHFATAGFRRCKSPEIYQLPAKTVQVRVKHEAVESKNLFIQFWYFSS